MSIETEGGVNRLDTQAATTVKIAEPKARYANVLSFSSFTKIHPKGLSAIKTQIAPINKIPTFKRDSNRSRVRNDDILLDLLK